MKYTSKGFKSGIWSLFLIIKLFSIKGGVLLFKIYTLSKNKHYKSKHF